MLVPKHLTDAAQHSVLSSLTLAAQQGAVEANGFKCALFARGICPVHGTLTLFVYSLVHSTNHMALAAMCESPMDGYTDSHAQFCKALTGLQAQLTM